MRKATAVVLRSERERKPKHGEPCTSCGICCKAAICPIGQKALSLPDLPGPCPALEPRPDGTYACGLVASAARYFPVSVFVYGVAQISEAVAHLIGAGTGCDARIDGEPADEAFYQKLKRWDTDNADKTAASVAKLRWTFGNSNGRRGS